jgi:hypothetical protein
LGTPKQPNPEHKSTEAEAHIKSAQQILKTLPEKIGEHPEIGAAITKLEMALNDLAIQTGGLLQRRHQPEYGAYALVQSFFQSVSATNSSKISCSL